MAYQKRRSSTLEKAQARLRGLQSIHPDLNLGNGLTLQNYAASIATSATRLQAHNLMLAEADRTRLEFSEAEAQVSTLSSRILSAVAGTYGRESKEYELAGGKPTGRYKRSKKQPRDTSQLQNINLASNNETVTNGATTNGATTNGARAMSLPQ